MADQHLVADGGFSERAAERFVIKQRVVSESARSARRIQDAAFHRPAKRANEFAILHEGDYAHESRPAVSNAGQALQQDRVVVCVCRFGTRVARRMNPRRAA